MRNADENTITQAVIDRLADAPNPRLKQISEALVRHAHNFIREVQLTEEEWAIGIEFLTRTGKICDGNRQEFILLSDTLGISMLVDAINHRFATGASETTVVGPFYVENPPVRPLGADVSGGMKGTPLYASGSVRSIDGKPIANAIVDIWHSDDDGYYDVQRLDKVGTSGRARFRADPEGRFRFWSVKPAPYPIPHDGPVGQMLQAQKRHPWRPAHLHFMIDAPGFVKLTTHVFVAGSSYLDSDAVFGVKDSLIVPFEEHAAGTAPDGRKLDCGYATVMYDFVLQARDQ
jgi:hydroxyquinol 1,2-dioxygenase